MTDIAHLSPEVDALDGFLSKIRWISDTHGIPMGTCTFQWDSNGYAE